MKTAFQTAFVGVLLGTVSCYATSIEFATDGAGQFGTIDLATGSFTQIGVQEPSTLWGMGWAGNALYGLDKQGDPNLVAINTSTGAISTVGATGLAQYSIMSSTTGGGLYAIDAVSSALYRVDPATGAAVFVANTGLPTTILHDYTSMAGDASDLYVTLNQTLYIVNAANGATTRVGDMSTSHMAGSAWANNRLYGFADDANLPFYTIDTANAQIALAGDATALVYFAASDQTDAGPEPGTVGLLSVGLAALGAVRCRRRAASALCSAASRCRLCRTYRF